MADEKENMHEGKIFRRSKRRSSILKESPGRKPLENMTEKHQQRRSKRVSFADTKTIKEFLAVAGSGTEWNSTYEATASCDSSNSMDITCMGERSNRSIIITPNDKPATGSDKKETLDSSAEESLGFVRDILDWDSSKCASGTVWDPFDEPEEVVPTNDSFLTSFLNMKSSDCVQDNGETSKADNYGNTKDQVKKSNARPLTLFSAAADDSLSDNQMDVLLRDEMAQQMIEDLKMTCMGETFNDQTKTNTGAKTGQTTDKVGLNQVNLAGDDINGHTSQIRTLLEGDLTFGDMDMTLGVCLGGGLLSPVNAKRTSLGVGSDIKDLPERVNADTEVTFPGNPASTLLHKSNVTEMIDHISLNREDITRRATTDMEITRPASQMITLSEGNMTEKNNQVNLNQDMTQKVTRDMELTFPSSLMSVHPKSYVDQKTDMDMELTYPSIRIVNQCDVDRTQTMNTITVNREDLTQKVSTDMEITCPISQMSNRSRRSVMNEKPSGDMEMTCQTLTVNREDLTQRVTADMEMTGQISQMTNRSRRSVMNEKPSGDMEMTCQTFAVNQDDPTQKATADMEMTGPISLMNTRSRRSVLNEKPSGDMELTCQTLTRNQDDTAHKVNSDIEVTCPAIKSTKPNNSGLTQKMIMMTLSQVALTENKTKDLKNACQSVLPVSLLEGNTTQKGNRAMELTCPVIAANHGVLTQKVTTEMEITCPISQANKKRISNAGMSYSVSQKKDIGNKTGQMNNSHDIDIDMEITSSSSNVSEKRENYCVQDTNADEEISRLGKTSASTPAVFPCDSLVSKSTFAETMPQVVESSDGTSVERIEKEDTCEVYSAGRAQRTNLSFGADSKPLKPNIEENDTGKIYGGDCAGVTKSAFINTLESHKTIDGKARDCSKNNTCPASQILEMLNRNEVPRRKSLCFGLSNSERFVDAIDKNIISPVERKEDQKEVSRRKSVPIMSPSEFNETFNMSRPMFQSFFEEPQDSEEELDAPAEGFDDKNVRQSKYGESLQEVSPKSNHKRSHDMDNEDERSSKRLSRDDGPAHLSMSVDNEKCQEGNNSFNPPPSLNGNKDPLSVSLSVEEDELFLHISKTEPLSGLSVEDKIKLDTPDLAISPSAKDKTPLKSKNSSSRESTVTIENTQGSNEKINLDGDSKLEAKNNSQSEEGLEDIQMDFESSCELSFSHSPLAKLESQSPTAPQSANQSLFDVVAADAFSSVKAMMTSFKKRVSDFHEGHSSLRNSLIDEDGLLIEMEKENAFPTSCDISLQGSSCNMPKDTKVGCMPETSSVGIDDQMISHEMDKEIFQGSNSSLITETPEVSNDKTAGNISSISIPDPFQSVMLELSDSKKDPGASVSINPEPASHVSAEAVQENSRTSLQYVPEQYQEETKTINTLEFIPQKMLEQKFCDLCCSSELLRGCFMPASSKDRWIVTGVEERVRYLTLEHSNLELEFKVTKTDSHWTVTTVSWKPQASEIKEKIGQLAMQLLQCRIKAAILPLYGHALCEIVEELDKVVSAYRDITKLTLELFLVQAAYLTEFNRDSIKVNLFSSVHHVNAYVTINLRPPEPTPEKPYAIQPSAEVTIGNLRSQAIENAMADVAYGPKYIWRLVKTADMVIQGMV